MKHSERLTRRKLHQADLAKFVTSSSVTPRIVNVDLRHCLTLRHAINRIAAALNAPEYFGQNLDALVDIVNDRPKGWDLVLISGWEELKAGYQARLEEALSANASAEEQEGPGYATFVILLMEEDQ